MGESSHQQSNKRAKRGNWIKEKKKRQNRHREEEEKDERHNSHIDEIEHREGLKVITQVRYKTILLRSN